MIFYLSLWPRVERERGHPAVVPPNGDCWGPNDCESTRTHPAISNEPADTSLPALFSPKSNRDCLGWKKNQRGCRGKWLHQQCNEVWRTSCESFMALVRMFDPWVTPAGTIRTRKGFTRTWPVTNLQLQVILVLAKSGKQTMRSTDLSVKLLLRVRC